jgi:hypothetical protein
MRAWLDAGAFVTMSLTTGCSGVYGANDFRIDPSGDDQLFIQQVDALVPDANCATTNSPNALYLQKGLIDVALRLDYQATLLVGVRRAPGAPAASVRLIQVESEVRDPTGYVLWGPLTVPVTGFIDVTGTDEVSYGLVEATLLGPEFTEPVSPQLAANPGLVRLLTASARVDGQVVGGTALRSDTWQFPLTACSGCLLTFPSEANDPNGSRKPNCDLPPTPGVTITRPCRVGQDDAVDCRTCKEILPSSSLCEPPK